MTEVEYQVRIHDLEKEVAKLQNEIKRNSTTNYGLRWMDVPEAFDSEDRIPILEEVKDKTIINNDGKPTHILIEGDNYHALTCLNYTHKGKVDVIYIDPPYNTGSDGFVYKDKRILDKFPDGQPVPTDHPLRHSYWLSFMEKRLRLAKNLLSDKGVIFISIDDNEMANLKLLCDQVFGENHFIADLIWQKKFSRANDALYFSTMHDHILCYCRESLYESEKGWKIGLLERMGDIPKGYANPDNDPRGVWTSTIMSAKSGSESLLYEIVTPSGRVVVPPSGRFWSCSKETFDRWNHEQRIWFGKDGNGTPRKKTFLSEVQEGLRPNTIIFQDEGGNNQEGRQELKLILGEGVFDGPKPTKLIKHLLRVANGKELSVLDFFAGSGTTMHATMALNAEDGGHRQCILVQMQEDSGICEKVTYERNKRVMCGYTNAKGQEVAALGGSLKYYRTDFVGEHCHQDATDRDRIALSQKAGNLLALAENTLEEVLSTNFYQIFKEKAGDISTNGNLFTCVYFSDDLDEFGDFVSQIEKLQEEYDYPHITVYLFCWDSPENYKEEFDCLRGISLKAIPQPILDIYKRINN